MKFLRAYAHGVDRVSWLLGLIVMYGLFAMIGVLLWSSISKAFFLPSMWTLEMAQFLMVAYFMLGGPYSILTGANVRMDLFYGSWSSRRKAAVDVITVLFLLFYLGVLLYGALSSTAYSLGYWGDEPLSFFLGLLTGAEEIGRLEHSPTAWKPVIWPIKLIMIIGIFLMLLQALSELAKDILLLAGDTSLEAEK